MVSRTCRPVALALSLTSRRPYRGSAACKDERRTAASLASSDVQLTYAVRTRPDRPRYERVWWGNYTGKKQTTTTTTSGIHYDADALAVPRPCRPRRRRGNRESVIETVCAKTRLFCFHSRQSACVGPFVGSFSLVRSPPPRIAVESESKPNKSRPIAIFAHRHRYYRPFFGHSAWSSSCRTVSKRPGSATGPDGRFSTVRAPSPRPLDARSPGRRLSSRRLRLDVRRPAYPPLSPTRPSASCLQTAVRIVRSTK